MSPVINRTNSSWFYCCAQILLYPQDNLSPVLCHAPVSRAWWTSSTGHVTVTRAVPRQWWSTWPEGHSRGMAPVVATSKGQSRPPGRRPLLAYSNPSPSSHGSEMVKSDRRGLILTKPNQTKLLCWGVLICVLSLVVTQLPHFRPFLAAAGPERAASRPYLPPFSGSLGRRNRDGRSSPRCRIYAHAADSIICTSIRNTSG